MNDLITSVLSENCKEIILVVLQLVYILLFIYRVVIWIELLKYNQ